MFRKASKLNSSSMYEELRRAMMVLEKTSESGGVLVSERDMQGWKAGSNASVVVRRLTPAVL